MRDRARTKSPPSLRETDTNRHAASDPHRTQLTIRLAGKHRDWAPSQRKIVLSQSVIVVMPLAFLADVLEPGVAHTLFVQDAAGEVYRITATLDAGGTAVEVTAGRAACSAG